MARIVWDELQARRYEAGVDRGVLYPPSGPGVAWNGLITVNESFEGGEVEPYYIDGIKYLDFVARKDFKATITAFSAPEEFAPCIGERNIIPGFVITRQPRERFGFSYRTGGSDGYKIHVVYNALATPSNKSYETTGDSVSPVNLEWNIDAIPPNTGGYVPIAHYIVDSRKSNAEKLEDFEAIIYGSSGLNPYLLTPENLIQHFAA